MHPGSRHRFRLRSPVGLLASRYKTTSDVISSPPPVNEFDPRSYEALPLRGVGDCLCLKWDSPLHGWCRCSNHGAHHCPAETSILHADNESLQVGTCARHTDAHDAHAPLNSSCWLCCVVLVVSSAHLRFHCYCVVSSPSPSQKS